MSQPPRSQQNNSPVKNNHVIEDSDQEEDSIPKEQRDTGTSSSHKQTCPNLSESTDKNTQKEPANRTQNRSTLQEQEENKNELAQKQDSEQEKKESKQQESQESDGESQFSKSESASESGSEEDSEEEQSETESKASALKPRKAKAQSKEEPAVSKKSQPKGQDFPSIQRTSQKKQGLLNSKEDIIQELMVRWWYVLPEWPPEDLKYDEVLKQKGYRAVPAQIFHFQNQTDDKGLRKVVALNNFVGVYRRSDGSILDVRPKDTMPCYANFNEKTKAELIQMLQKALENQIRALKNTPSYQNKGQDVKFMKQVCRLYLTVKKLKV